MQAIDFRATPDLQHLTFFDLDTGYGGDKTRVEFYAAHFPELISVSWRAADFYDHESGRHRQVLYTISRCGPGPRNFRIAEESYGINIDSQPPRQWSDPIRAK
jgi:hypothetical protein